MPKKLSEKVLSWASILEPEAAEQAVISSRMPFITPHIALMPDAHLGKGSTVGSVIPTNRAIIPAAIGVDIGCGMSAIRTTARLEDVRAGAEDIREEIERTVPLGPGKYTSEVAHYATPHADRLAAMDGSEQATNLAPNWPKQLGTLGGGNHFIEVSADEEDHMWVFLHSGSRGVGNKIAQHHIKVAQRWCERAWIELPDRDLAYLVEGTPEFWEYIKALNWAQAFAAANRSVMVHAVLDAVRAVIPGTDPAGEEILCHHNYTAREHHMGRDLWITRKGAIAAREGTLGLIPGSMGTRSFVVRGKGHPASFNSAPHGAGRAMSRTEARRRFTADDLAARMVGITARVDERFVDEIPDAYKPIWRVMEDSQDLVEVVHELRQIINVKGE